jgi:hypothetical protein
MSKSLLSLSAVIALIAATPSRSFTIAGEPFSETDIIDARMQPDLNGFPTVLIRSNKPPLPALPSLPALISAKR